MQNHRNQYFNFPVLSYSILFLIILFTGCSSETNSSNNRNDNGVPPKQITDPINQSDIETHLLQNSFLTLYADLLQFKNKNDFITNGFKKEGPYYYWIKELNDLKESKGAEKLIQEGIIVSDLEVLGLAYSASAGEETQVTKALNEAYSETLNNWKEAH